ncbi:MAG: UDP-N-acetylmuramate dehydrogenase [Patescibacteria group bacterium]
MIVLENSPLSEITYYRIGGIADYILKIESLEEVKEALIFCRQKNITRPLVLGLGSNVILPDSHVKGAILWLEGNGSSFTIKDTSIKAFAGESMDSLIKESLSASLVGLEWAGGLPSTIGGAVRGNAGAFGHETKDTFFEAEVIDMDDPAYAIKTFAHQEAQFGYRNSFFKQHPNLIIVSVTFQLKIGTLQEIAEAEAVYKKNINYRQTHHPMEYPSCGSVFKNIVKPEEVEKILNVWPDIRELSEKKWHNKISMGYVINRLGFSNKRVGGAQVSSKHANYISNVDHAKGEDVKVLIKEIQATFNEIFGFVPEPEVVVTA